MNRTLAAGANPFGRPSIAIVILAASCLFVADAHAGQTIRVPSQASLADALAIVEDGDTIEIQDGAVLSAPFGGWQAEKTNCSYTMRAEDGGTATLDGGGSTEIMTIKVSDGHLVTVKDLMITNGWSGEADVGSGVTVREGRVTFVRCSFVDNDGDPPVDNSSVGALRVVSSIAYLLDCEFTGNTARTAGGGVAVQNGTVWAHRCLFTNNRTDVLNHRSSAAGGAIHVGNGVAWLSDCRFDGNRAGYVGGAVYAIGDFPETGDDPSALVTASNCTFDGNVAAPDDSVSLSVPTEGGAFHVENQATGKIYSSRFFGNTAENGGAINTYRGVVEVVNSVLVANMASDGYSAFGRGGGIGAVSNDTANATTDFGQINRRASTVSVQNSAIIGGGDQIPLAQAGGGVQVAGDVNRIEGSGGVGAMGTVAENRAVLTIDGVLLAGLRTTVSDGSSAKGGGISVRAADLTLQDSMIVRCSSVGDDKYSQGGGMMLNQYASTSILGGEIAGNVSDNTTDRDFCGGGGISMFGSELIAQGVVLAFNQLSPGYSEGLGSSNGAALYSSPDSVKGLDISGSIAQSLLVSNDGLPVWEFDYDDGPINDLRFNGNDFWEESFDDLVYKNTLAGGGVFHTPQELNSFEVVRSGAPNTDKSSSPNTELQATPVFGRIRAAPESLPQTGAVGDPETGHSGYIGWTWSGTSATLDGQELIDNTGYQMTHVGNHELEVDGVQYPAGIASAPLPTMEVTVDPISIASGEASMLSWHSDTPGFVALAIDNTAGHPVAVSGTVEVFPTQTTTYRVFLITEYGGVVEEATVYVDEDPPTPDLIFGDGFESGSVDNWSSSS